MTRARAVKPVVSIRLVRAGVGPDSKLTVKFIRAGAKSGYFTNISAKAFQLLDVVIAHLADRDLLGEDWPVDVGMSQYYLRVTLNTSTDYAEGLVGLDQGERRAWGCKP